MNKVERMQVFGEKKKVNNTITTHNKEQVKNKKKFTHTLEPPTLRLDTDYGSTLYLKLCESSNKALRFEANLRYREDGSLNRTDHLGYSANIFPELNNILEVKGKKLDDVLLEFCYSLIILGRIYEAICKSGLSMDDVEFDKDVLNDFVNKSLEFYGCRSYDFDYFLTTTMVYNTITSYTALPFLDKMDECKEFSISENNYILGYNGACVYLRLNKDTVDMVLSKSAVKIRYNIKELSSSIQETLAWVLLASKGFYVHNQKFVNTSLDFDDVIENLEFENKQEITPDNFAQCFKQS